jgi:hypothetical protein
MELKDKGLKIRSNTVEVDEQEKTFGEYMVEQDERILVITDWCGLERLKKGQPELRLA